MKRLMRMIASLAIAASCAISAVAQDGTVESIAGDFARRLLFDGATWESAEVQENVALLSEGEAAKVKNYADTAYIVNRRYYIPFKKAQLSENAANLTVEERDDLYEEAKVSGSSIFLLNLIPFLNLGSFIYKDYIGAAASFAMYGVSFAVFQSERNKGYTDEHGDYHYEGDPKKSIPCLCGSYAISLITPWIFSAVVNNGAYNALGVNSNSKTTSVSVLPIVNPVDNQYGLLAHVSL